MRIRLVALVQATDIHPTGRHSYGMPAELQPEHPPPISPLPWPTVLVIRQEPDGVFLDRYTEDGRLGGDTWHLTIQDAKGQAEDEYMGLVTPWKEVPPRVTDENLIQFALLDQV